MPALDSDLAAGLKTARTKPMFFALIVKGTEGKLLVGKKKVSAKDIADAKKECGGGTIYQGKCHGEENGSTMVFEVLKEAPSTAASAARKIIKDSTGLTFKAVEFRVNAAAEDEGQEAQTQETTEPAPAAAPPAADASAAPTSTPGDPEAARFGERLKLLAPLLQQALAGGKPEAAQAKTKMGEASTFFRNRDFAQANALLDQAEPLIKQALSGGAKPDASSSPDAAAQAWQTQFATLEPRILEALKGDSAEVNKLRVLMTFATTKANAREYAKALATLKQIETLLKPTASKDGAAPPVNDAFYKAWTSARSDLQVAIDKVGNQLARFAVAILETNEPNLVWVAEEGITRMLTSLRDDAIAIDRATSKTPAKVVAKAKPVIDSLRKQLTSPQVKACDNNNLAVTVSINGTIGQAIKRLEDALALA